MSMTPDDNTKNNQDAANESAETSADAPVEDSRDTALRQAEARIQELEARLRTVSAAYREKNDEIASAKERLARAAQVQEEIRRGEVVAGLFEPVENLHRSLDAAKNMPEEFVHGLRMVHQEFMDALKRLGLEEVPTTGRTFDPSLHEAIATMPVTEKSQDNVVVSVFSAGYRIGNRLIRPARVVIGTYAAEA